MISDLLESSNKASRRQEEDDNTKYLTKGQLYRLVSDQYYLPAVDSKGVTRQWLIGVLKGVFFRVDFIVLKKFEAEIKASLLKKISFVSLQDLVTRLNRFLLETNQDSLGFADGVVPEEEWLMRVARFSDPTNVLGVFTGPIPLTQAPHCPSSEMHVAQKNAATYLLGNNLSLLKVTTVLNSVKAVAVTFQKLVMVDKERDLVERQLQSLDNKHHKLENELNSAILKASTTVLAHGEGLENPEDIFEPGEKGETLRGKLNQVSNIIRFCYTIDPVTNRTEFAMMMAMKFFNADDVTKLIPTPSKDSRANSPTK